MKDIGLLVCTLGTWGIVPEILGFLEPDTFPIFPEKHIKRWKEIPRTSLREIWVVATDGNRDAIESLKEWWNKVAPGNKRLKLFKVIGTGDLSTLEENDRIAEAIFRVVLHARRLCNQYSINLYLSLAGGRKTMSAFLQKAGSIFGTDGLFHVISSREAEKETRKQSFTTTLREDIAVGFTPVFLGREEGMEGMDDELDLSNYPLPLNDEIITPLTISEPFLYREVEEKMKESYQIAVNFIHNLMESEYRENFKSLYRLPRREIERLKNTKIGASPGNEDNDISWLKKIPKAELHCHLGGVASVQETFEIARANKHYILPYESELEDIFKEHKSIIEGKFTAKEKIRLLEKENRKMSSNINIPEYIRNTYFLLLIEKDEELLDQLTCITDIPVGITRYEKAGDFQGSKLLQTEEAIKTACSIIYRKAVEDNVRYIEIRCSPLNYTKGGLSEYEVVKAIRRGFKEAERLFSKRCQVELIFIGSRHRTIGDMKRHIELALQLAEERHESIRVVGFDVAGDESVGAPEELRKIFLPLFDRCMRLTIHAGETEEVENIWQAVYHLNADRIGHGLRLLERSDLMEKIKNQGTAIELCPSSNFQIVGYRDFWDDSTNTLPVYPLSAYITSYLPVTINTDNPGISRTDLSSEYLKASRMVAGGLSKWAILSIIRCGFKSAFLPFDEKIKLLLEVDKEICRVLQDEVCL